jgi:hypothetical protein
MTSRFSSAEMSPAQFERWIVDLFSAMAGPLSDLTVSLHETIKAADGTYDFDATVRYRVLGLDFLVIVEAKHHSHPIKRELVQVLHDKIGSVGAHKGVMVATAPYQSGALQFAAVHGIALVSVVDGSLVYETRGSRTGCARPDMSGSPAGYAQSYEPTTRRTRRTLLSLRSAPEMIEALELPVTRSAATET